MGYDELMVIAHRGAAGESPENTLAAFRLALDQGCDAFELDIHLSLDGHLMVIHDYTVDRTTDGSGAVKDLTLDELRRFDAGSRFDERFRGERIPTLEEVFDLAPEHLKINVEIKGGDGIEERLVELLRRKGRMETVFVSSFQFKSLATLNRLEPTLKVGLLYNQWLQAHALLPKAAGVDAYSLHPNYKSLEEEHVQAILAEGLAVYPWTVDKEKEMLSMIEAGVSGIITNYPGRLRGLLDRLKTGADVRG